MLVLSSPSGAGKTTLTKKIQESDNSFKASDSSQKQKLSLYYKTPNTFILESKVQSNKRKVTSLWTRKNLFTWQLTSINLSYYKSIAH